MRDSKTKARPYWRLLLLLPFIGVLWPPFYTSVQPSLSGIPFFFWYQFLWILIASAITAVVYKLEKA